MKQYPIKDVPIFIDQIIPEVVSLKYNNWFGKYSSGLINTDIIPYSIFTKEGDTVLLKYIAFPI